VIIKIYKEKRFKVRMGLEEGWNRWRELALIFLKEDKRVYIKDVNGNWFFGEILLVGEEMVYIQCFAPEQRAGERVRVYYPVIVKFEEFKEEL